ncbi:MAG TPA: ABC transporter permease [Terracidiphilus sp.]|jgi:putative ABC transport system permease protein|nr:ABC transporter permease [Terracidiphilus sp.]
MRQWWSKIRSLFSSRPSISDELGEEMEAHLQFLIEDNLARGMTPAQARAAAHRHFGNQALVRERAYTAWQFPSFETILQDIRYGIRGIFRAPAFALIVILTLAVGVGANTAIFSAVYTVLLKPLPFPSGQRLVWLGESAPKAEGISVTWINFQHWQNENHSFETMAGFQTADLTLTGRGQAVLTHAGVVTSQFFALTGSRAMLGRLFTASDDDLHSPATVVVNEGFWSKNLGADPRIVGKPLMLDGASYEIIGVLPRDPGFFLRTPDYYLPFRPSPQQLSKRSAHGSMRVLALLKPGVTLAQSRSDLDSIMERLAHADPGPEDTHRAYAQFLTQERTGDVSHALALLMGAVAFVLLLSCANVGGLLLMRVTTRAREMAIRSALGAARARLARQLVTETLLLASIGGAFGMLLAALGLRAMVALGPRDIPRLSEATLDIPVLLFATALTLAVGLLCALVPVFSSGRVNLNVVLRESSAGSGAGRLGHTLRTGLVVAEVAAAVVLLFTSGLLLRSLFVAETASPGFDPSRVLALELQLPPIRYKSDPAILDFYSRLESALRAQPSVLSVGAVNCPPAAGDCEDWWYSIQEKPAPSRDNMPLTLLNTADPGYFQTMRIPILAGRGPSPQDTAGAPPVAIINQVLAQTWFPDPQAAIGRHIKIGGPYTKGPLLEIVGVTANVSQMGLDADPLPEILYPAAQHVDHSMVVMIRTSGNPEALVDPARRVMASIDPNVPIQSLKTADEWLGATLLQRRFIALLLSVFAAIAVVLAAIGVFGVLNSWVGSRRQEIAIRKAMGARTAAILRRTGRQAAVLAFIGLAIGLGGSWAAARWMKSLVYGVSAHDPLVLSGAAIAALLIVLLAAAVPLARAARVDPIAVLHEP